MGKIVDSKTLRNGKIKYQIIMSKEETLSLYGRLKDVYIFSLKAYSKKAEIMETGIKNSAKYFQIPHKWIMRVSSKREKINEQLAPISCQRIETKDKYAFIYIIPKQTPPKHALSKAR